MRFVIVGGSDAGISAALRARELDPTVDITVILADAFPNYSIWGLPFYLSGETPDWRHFAHRTEFEGVELLTNHAAQEVDLPARTVAVTDQSGAHKLVVFDTLAHRHWCSADHSPDSGYRRAWRFPAAYDGGQLPCASISDQEPTSTRCNRWIWLHRARNGGCAHT